MKTTKIIVPALGGLAVAGMVLDGADLTDFNRYAPVDQAVVAVPSSAPSMTVMNNITGDEINLPPIPVARKLTFPST